MFPVTITTNCDQLLSSSLVSVVETKFIYTNNKPSSPFRHANLKVVQGDACDINSFESALTGKDAVLSCLGSKNSKGPFAFTTLYSDTMKNIIEAMKRYRSMLIFFVLMKALKDRFLVRFSSSDE
jgi:hypothetical protein